MRLGQEELRRQVAATAQLQKIRRPEKTNLRLVSFTGLIGLMAANLISTQGFNRHFSSGQNTCRAYHLALANSPWEQRELRAHSLRDLVVVPNSSPALFHHRAIRLALFQEITAFWLIYYPPKGPNRLTPGRNEEARKRLAKVPGSGYEEEGQGEKKGKTIKAKELAAVLARSRRPAYIYDVLVWAVQYLGRSI
ncbi:hypothetical protein K470DRAFT_152411 [Piedraia hortae CBS 480.64]|uniref:Uncharacterized protein n=1 Tax=Piedraia hortae CBS 480.64 TaxID=1314780 RepID=A0A6A7BT15_9PEZI|nr:hypothetical protein K470DRAFT_152411 [Piedraia hortae CBS 480.64]